MSIVRLIALAGIIGLAIVAGAILTRQDVKGWIVGLAIGKGAVILSSIVFLSRRLSQ